jgi:hypothetical protein
MRDGNRDYLPWVVCASRACAIDDPVPQQLIVWSPESAESSIRSASA